jgi:hypothetical protein
LVQLDEVPPGTTVFGEDFNYLSGSTSDATRYFSELSNVLRERFDLQPDDLVVDIGSNDGSFLRFFEEKGLSVLGIEPTPKPAAAAIAAGIPTIGQRFEEAIEEILTRSNGRIRLLTALNVLAHTDTIHEFLECVKKVLVNNNSTFVSQSHYLPKLIENCEYDTIYHEHARYYTATSLQSMLASHGISLFDVKESDYYGGSLIAYAGIGREEQTSELQRILSCEQYLREPKTYSRFADKVMENRLKLRALLTSLKSDGKRLAGIGAPMKSSTILNYCGIDGSILDYLAEVNPLKVGTYSPGVHIKVVSEEHFFEDPPEVALILSWNVANSIMRKFRNRGYNGQFIIPIPEPRMAD